MVEKVGAKPKEEVKSDVNLMTELTDALNRHNALVSAVKQAGLSLGLTEKEVEEVTKEAESTSGVKEYINMFSELADDIGKIADRVGPLVTGGKSVPPPRGSIDQSASVQHGVVEIPPEGEEGGGGEDEGT